MPQFISTGTAVRTSQTQLRVPAGPSAPVVPPAASAHHLQTLKRYLSNPKWLVMYLLGRFEICKRLAIGFARLSRARARRGTRSLFQEIDVDQAVEALRRDAYVGGLQLPRHVVDEIRAFADAHPCYPDRDPAFPFAHDNHEDAQRRYGRRILLGRYYNTATACAAIRQLESDPVLVDLAAAYLGVEPVHIGNRLWWSFATRADETDRVRSGQGFHWDLDDWRTVTFFFYLTDVDDLAGPHVLVRGSHRRKRWRHLLSMYKSRPEAEVLTMYGKESLVTLRGPAGFGFAEDLFCFHRGSPPVGSDRLIVQIRFGVFDYDNAHDRLPGK